MDPLATRCTITANPDIAGVGVRTSMYIQAVLALFPAFLSTARTRQYKYFNDDLSSAFFVLLTGFALLGTSYIIAAKYGLSVYHGLIILNLSWLNSFTSVIPVVIRWTINPDRPPLFHKSLLLDPVLIASTLHFCAMGILGIWMYSDLNAFGGINSSCTSSTLYWTFGQLLLVTNASFRHTWLAIYILAVTPILNVALFCLIILGTIRFLSFVVYWILPLCCKSSDNKKWNNIVDFVAVSSTLVYVGMVIASTEGTATQNRVGVGEDRWTFGQILAMLMTVLPLISAWNYFNERKRMAKESEKKYLNLFREKLHQKSPHGDEQEYALTDNAERGQMVGSSENSHGAN